MFIGWWLKWLGWQWQVNGWRVKTQTTSGVQIFDRLSGSIDGAWHVSFFDWFLSQIKVLLHLPCTFSINITPVSSHFFTFCRKILSEHVHHNCQRPVCSIPASFVLIHSLFGLVSNFFPFLLLFYYLLFSFWNPLFSFCAPVTLS